MKVGLTRLPAAFWKCSSVSRRHVAALTNLGSLSQVQGELRAAEEYYRAALEVAPGDRIAQGNRLVLLNYDPKSTPESLLAEHRAWVQSQPSVRGPARHANDRNPHRPLRVGYVSADLRRHPVGRFIEPVLRNHDPTRVQPFIYANLFGADEMTNRLQTHGGSWRTIVDDTDDVVARQIQADAIDILVDLSGHTAKNRLGVFALKPAPLQVTYLGYPCTTGLPSIRLPHHRCRGRSSTTTNVYGGGAVADGRFVLLL